MDFSDFTVLSQLKAVVFHLASIVKSPGTLKKKKKCCLGPSPDILGCVLSNRIFYSVNQPDGAQPWLQIVYHSMCFYTSLCVYGALNNTVACVLKMYENCILLSVPLGSWFFTLALFGCIWG